MDTSIAEEINRLNVLIQHLTPDDGPAKMRKAYNQLHKLVDQLRHRDMDNPRYLTAWNLLTHYGNIELQDVLFYYNYTNQPKPSLLAKRNYEKVFIRFRDLIDMAVSVLPKP